MQASLAKRALSVAVRNLGRRKVRTALTLLGVILSAIIVVTIFAVSWGMRLEAERSMNELLGSGVMVSSRRRDLPSIPEEVGSTIEALPGVVRAVPVAFTLGYRNDDVFMIFGVEPADLEEAFQAKLLEGKFPSSFGEALVSSTTARNFGLSVGDEIKITSRGGSFTLKVVGILRPAWLLELMSGFLGSGRSGLIVVPVDAAQKMASAEGLVSMFLVRVGDPSYSTPVAEAISEIFPDARVIEQRTLMESINRMFSLIDAVRFSFLAVAVAIGSVGVANTMAMSVREQTREIGIMKAVGAERWFVMLTFLAQALIIGLAGGVLGSAAGTALAMLLKSLINSVWSVEIPLVFSPEVYALTLAVSVGSCVVAGLIPSWKAASIRPVEAIRYHE